MELTFDFNTFSQWRHVFTEYVRYTIRCGWIADPTFIVFFVAEWLLCRKINGDTTITFSLFANYVEYFFLHIDFILVFNVISQSKAQIL